jgi:hypothetical protein
LEKTGLASFSEHYRTLPLDDEIKKKLKEDYESIRKLFVFFCYPFCIFAVSPNAQ